jgi:hypothetical protein
MWFADLELPEIDLRGVQFDEHEEADALYAALEALGQQVADARRGGHGRRAATGRDLRPSRAPG